MNERMLAILMSPLRLMRRLYDWTMSWADSRHALIALATLAFVESSFFPVPPDALLIALCIGSYRRWASFATVTSVFSVLGGMAGYGIGFFAFDTIGRPLMNFVASLSGQDTDFLISQAQFWFNEKQMFGMHVGAWAVGAAGLTPIPYKVFTISAGFFHMDFPIFVIASALSRSLRFFAVAGTIGLLYKRYGDGIKGFIDRYFNWLAVLFLVLLVGGALVIRTFSH